MRGGRKCDDQVVVTREDSLWCQMSVALILEAKNVDVGFSIQRERC